MSAFRRLKFKEYIEVNKMRKALGMPPVKMGDRTCLRCDSRFFSEDLSNQHICDLCRLDRTIDSEIMPERRGDNDEQT